MDQDWGAGHSGHSAAPRYLQDDPNSEGGDLFRLMLHDVVVPQVDPLAHNILMVTSFNEWHEDTQIEASAGHADSTRLDDSSSGIDYTEGNDYSDYGDLYLNILRDESCLDPADLNHDCQVDFLDFSLWALGWKQVQLTSSSPYDLNGDGVINTLDLKVLTQSWLTCPRAKITVPDASRER